MPALTKFYGLRPWELEQFTPAELAEYFDYYDAWQREQRKAMRR